MKSSSTTRPSSAAGAGFAKSTTVGLARLDRGLRVSVLRGLQTVAPRTASHLARDIFSTPPPVWLSDRGRAFLSTGGRFTVEFGSGRLAAWRWGSGPRVYLLHGWGGQATQFRTFVPELVRAGFSVVAFDAPAHGLSGGQRSTLPLFAEALQAVVKAAGPAYAVIAHSMGSPATAMAIRNGLSVSRLVFLSPPAALIDFTRGFAARVGLLPKTLERMERGIERHLGASLDSLSVEQAARGLTNPLQVWHDVEDAQVSSECGRRYAASWQNCELKLTSGLGHNRILHAAAVIQGAIRFLEAGEPPSCGCGRRLGGTFDTETQCSVCAVEADLFNPSARRVLACSDAD